MALGGLAGGLVYFSSSNQGFAVAPATKLRQHHNVQTGQTPPSSASTSLPTMMVGGAVLAAAAASGRTSRSHAERTPQVARAVTPYELNGNVLADLEFSNDVGYLPDGTPMNRAGNAINHPENMGPDSHEWEGMKQTTPIISGGMNALRLPAFFENLGHSNVILTAGGGSFGHKDGPKPGAISCRQGEEAWKAWKAGQYGNISLSDGVIEFAKTHEEIK
ncbi:rbcL, partial [Symbiodinium sp. KB8]